MQANGSHSDISPSSILRMLTRRKLYLLIPAILLIPAVCFYALRLPQRFRARALVGAEPLIPGQPPSTGRGDPGILGAQEEMRTVRDMLLSPAVVDSLGGEFNLASSSLSGRSGDTKEDLRSRIQIQLDGPNAFFLGFEGPDPKQATEVANRLADLFVERTSALRGQQIEQHDSVLDEELLSLQRVPPSLSWRDPATAPGKRPGRLFSTSFDPVCRGCCGPQAFS